MTFFLVINHKFRISPCFPCFGYISLCFAKIIFSPLLSKMYPPIFEKFTCFLHTFCVFRFPLYFHHDAFMHARTGRPWKSTGASIPPEAMMHFPSVSDFLLFQKNFQTLWKIFQILPFPEKFFDFHPPKFLMTFFSHQPQI